MMFCCSSLFQGDGTAIHIVRELHKMLRIKMMIKKLIRLQD